MITYPFNEEKRGMFAHNAHIFKNTIDDTVFMVEFDKDELKSIFEGVTEEQLLRLSKSIVRVEKKQR